MPEVDEGRTESRPFVSLASNSGASVEPDGDSERAYDDAEASESSAEGDGPERSAGTTEGDEEEGLPEPPTAEELGLAEDSPEYRAAYKKLMAQWGKWTNRFAAKRKQPKGEEREEASARASSETQEQSQPGAGAEDSDPFDSLYRVDFDAFKPEVRGRDNSDLGEYRDEIVEIATQVARQMVQHTLNGVRSNDISFRKRNEVQSREARAYDVVSKYIEAISDHPEFGEKEKALADFAAKTRSFAIDDPEEWVDTVERKFGLVRSWRDDEGERRGQRIADDRRTSQKLRSIVQRPTAGAKLTGAPRGDLSFDQAFERAMSSGGRRA